MANRKILIVGGGGFIGRHLCRQARDGGDAVVSLSLNEPRFQIEGVEDLRADLVDRGSVNSALGGRRFTHVVNAGGYILHQLFKEGGRDLIRAHFDGLQNLIEVLDRSELQRFVNIGSSDEYGDTPAPQGEANRESPISPYSLGKAAATQLLQMLWRSEQFPSVTLRLFLTYGPGQDSRRFIPQLIQGCLADKTFPVSEGRQKRDFCFVGDIAGGVLRSLDVDAANGEVFNLASGQSVAIREVIETVQRVVGLGEPDYGKIPYRPGENMELYADVTRARSVLGWEAETSLEDGLRQTIDSYR